MKQPSKLVSTGKSRFARKAVLASLAVAAVTVASPQAFAAVICSSPALNVPVSTTGIYVNSAVVLGRHVTVDPVDPAGSVHASAVRRGTTPAA